MYFLKEKGKQGCVNKIFFLKKTLDLKNIIEFKFYIETLLLEI